MIRFIAAQVLAITMASVFIIVGAIVVSFVAGFLSIDMDPHRAKLIAAFILLSGELRRHVVGPWLAREGK